MAVCLLGCLLSATGWAEPILPTVSVTGSGRVQAAPDTAHLDAGITSDATGAQEAIRHNSEGMRRVFEALEARGIPRSDIQTRQLQLSPVYGQNANGRRGRVTGYRATSRIRVRVPEIEEAGAVLDTLVSVGANELGTIVFAVRDPAPPLDRARVAAVADAKRKAALLARESGGSLGKLLEIRDAAAPGHFPAARGVRMEGGFAAQSLPVASGELEFSAEVVLVYSLEGSP